MFRYRGFISYSQKDKKWAKKIQRALETYKIPKDFSSGDNKKRKLGRFFRDDEDLAGAPSLGAAIKGALDDSECLVVVCSRAAAQSKWVNDEIRYFQSNIDNRLIFAVFVDGEPNAADPHRECFPESLRPKARLDADSYIGTDEPLAPDIRKVGLRRTVIAIIAGILRCKLDDLIQRDARRTRFRILSWAATLMLILVIFGLVLGNFFTVSKKLRKTNQDKQYRSAVISNTIMNYEKFLSNWPQGEYSNIVQTILSYHKEVHKDYPESVVLESLGKVISGGRGEIESMEISYDNDDNCSKENDIRQLYEAQAILFTYYYLVRMHLNAGFGYPQSKFQFRWIWNQSETKITMPDYNFANLIYILDEQKLQNLLKSFFNIAGRYRASIEFFLEKALEYESYFEENWSESIEARIDENLVQQIHFEFSDLGFYADSFSCYNYSARANIKLVPNVGKSTFISLRGFEEYIYGFWYRRNKEGTAEITKRFITFALSKLQSMRIGDDKN